MAQDTTGTNLKATATATSRKLSARLMLDWDDVGFDAYPTGWHDETEYLLEAWGEMRAISWQRGAAGVGGGVSAMTRVRLRNPDLGAQGFRFSSSNTAGPLYAKLGEGKVNMVRAILECGFYDGATPERLRQHTGYVVSATENYAGRSITLELRDRAADSVLARASTALYENISAREYLAILVALFGKDPVAPGDRIFDRGAVEPQFQWLDDESIWDEIAIVAEAQAGRVWFDKDGQLHFDDSTHWAKGAANTWDDPTISQAVFTVSSFADLQPTYSLDSVFNHVIIEYSPRYPAFLQPVYTASEIVVVDAGETDKSHTAQFHDPSLGGVIEPVAKYDYRAFTAGGQDMTDQVTVTVAETFGGSAKLLISNSNIYYSAHLTKLQLRGTPLLSDASVKYEVEDGASIARYGRRTWTMRRNPYVHSEAHASMLADFMLSRFKSPIQTVALRGVPARPWLEVGDRVTIQEAKTGINADYYLTEIRWRYRAGGYTMDLTGIRVSDLFPEGWGVPGPGIKPYFVVGESQYGANKRLYW